MRTIVLRPRKSFDVSVEAEKVSPDVLAGLSPEEIRAQEVWEGNRKMTISDLFDVCADSMPADPKDALIRLEGDFSKVKRIGENMSTGSIVVQGSVGMRAGAGMSGGLLDIKGNADDWLGMEMHAGEIRVFGDAGNYAGSGYRGEKCGMRAGEIEILGRAGDHLGDHMCGGSIRVSGDAGDFPGARNQGGTIFIGGRAYLPGAEMTKGSITILGEARVLPSYKREEIVVLEGRSFQKYAGDLVENGKGELYVAQH
jgi:formylmethanofuran dehydrogenase subunit C